MRADSEVHGGTVTGRASQLSHVLRLEGRSGHFLASCDRDGTGECRFERMETSMPSDESSEQRTEPESEVEAHLYGADEPEGDGSERKRRRKRKQADEGDLDELAKKRT